MNNIFLETYEDILAKRKRLLPISIMELPNNSCRVQCGNGPAVTYYANTGKIEVRFPQVKNDILYVCRLFKVTKALQDMTWIDLLQLACKAEAEANLSGCFNN